MIKVSRALLYCTKGKMNLRKSIKDKDYYLDNGSEFNIIPKEDYSLNGKIAIECDFEVEEITNCGTSFMIMKYDDLQESYKYTNKIAKGSCLDYTDLRRYLGIKNGYAIHIKNLNIFDKPKELSEYHKIEEVGDMLFTELLTKSPKNMMRVSINHWNYFTYNTEDIRIMIPVSPEEMCRIANKEQDILIRKRVLKEILNND